MSTNINVYLDSYNSVKKSNPWIFPSQHAIMALPFTQKNKPYHHEVFKAVKNAFKRKGGWGSLLADPSDEFVYCLMQLSKDEPDKSVTDLVQLRKRFKEAGFSQSAPLTYCAYALSNKSQDQQERIIRKTYTLYGLLKKAHPFLTTSSDIPILLMLAERAEEAEELMRRYEEVYAELVSSGFSKSTALQSAALALTLLPITVNSLAEQCLEIKGFLKENKMPTNADIYILMPLLLSSQARHAADMTEILEIANSIKSSKSVKWLGRTEILVLAAFLKIFDRINDTDWDNRTDRTPQLQVIFETMAYIQYARVTQQSAYTVSTGVYS